MSPISIKRELDSYIPLLTLKQQVLLLDMVKNILQVEPVEKRISVKQYNKELNASIKQVKEGKTISQTQLLKEMEKW
jgi:hypothetical protein